MQNPVQEAKEQIRELILSAMGQAVAEGQLPSNPIPSFTIETPGDIKNGDFATNAAMVCAKVFQMPPRKIAETITGRMVLTETFFSRVEVAGPGFINFFLADTWFRQVLLSAEACAEAYGRTDYGKNKKVMVEFVSANPTGPMHIGNARGGAMGDVLASVLDWSGHQVSREFYVNDAGNQINKFAVSLECRYLQVYDPAVVMPEDAYLGADITEHAANFNALYGDRYLHSPSEERKQVLVAYALPLNIQGLERDLLKYRIRYDNWFLESTIHNGGEEERVIALFKEKGATYESEGALWFKGTEYGADQDFVLIRSNGVPTYVTPDIVYHYNKLVTRGFDLSIDVLGADHHGYAPRLKAAMKALGIDPDRLDFILMQMVRLVRGGEVIKASKRSGKSITLVTLLEEVPIDAARFYFNMREANAQMDFDLDLAVEESSKNPVFYVQYAHARICSILRNLKEAGVHPKPGAACDLSLLSSTDELALIRHIAAFPEEIANAAKLYEPSRVTKYTIEMATLFHKFYNTCRVAGEDAPIQFARLCLCQAVRTVLANALGILKIDAPESM